MGRDGTSGGWAWHDDVRHTEELLAVSVARMYYIIVMRFSLVND